MCPVGFLKVAGFYRFPFSLCICFVVAEGFGQVPVSFLRVLYKVCLRFLRFPGGSCKFSVGLL